MNKKFTMTLFGTAILCMISASSVFAATGKVTGNSVRIREKASTDSSIVETVSKNTEVEVISEEGDFYKITYESKEGYIHKDYVKVDLSKEENSNTTSESSENVDNNSENTNNESDNNDKKADEQKDSKIGNTLNSDSNLYLMPTLSSSKIDSLKKNTKVKVERTVSNWSYVTYKNKAGWLPNHKLLEINNNSEEDNKEDSSDKEINKSAYLSASAANLREGPGTDYKSIGGLKENEVITVLEEKDGWYKVKTSDNLEGYVLKSLVTIDKKATSRSGERKIEVIDLDKVEEKKVASKEEKKEDKKEETPKKESSSSSSADKKRKELVAYAKKYLGYKYVSGGSSPKTGFDCSGFTKYVYGHFGYKLNRTSSDQIKNGTKVSKSKLKVGDLLIFTGHVGIYIGNNKFIHASNPSDGVKITSLSDSYYVRNYIQARRIIK